MKTMLKKKTFATLPDALACIDRLQKKRKDPKIKCTRSGNIKWTVKWKGKI